MKLNIKKAGKWINKHNPIILSFLTCGLIAVTIISIFTVSYSSNVAIYLATERQKQEIWEDITLSHNLILELEWNKLHIYDTFQNINRIENITEVKRDQFKTLSLTKAREKSAFGNPLMRKQLELYDSLFLILKRSLSQIEMAELQGNRRLKKEHIDAVHGTTGLMIDGNIDMLNINTFIEVVREYHLEQVVEYNTLNKKSQEKLLKFYD